MKPIVKWAGGKTQLLSEIEKRMPIEYNNYFEPFIGGGAVFFNFAPSCKKIVINDINEELINLYESVRDCESEFVAKLKTLDDEHESAADIKEYYLSKRARFNAKIAAGELDVEQAALFVYINKHCFNGLYRVNSKGLFNVPFNKKKSGKSFDERNINEISDYLKIVTIKRGDFEDAVSLAKKGDFVFFDSPYAPLKADSFESYTKDGFAYDEHVRLANLYKALSEKGVYCMLTNHNTDLINELYADYKIDVVSVKRMINSDAKNRVGEEVIITNYEY